MTVRWTTAFLDLPAGVVEAGVRFWTTVTGYGLSPWRGASAEFATLLPPDGDPFLRVQRVGSTAAGCHLDLHVDDLEDRTASAVGAGATVLGGEPGLVVLRSPGGFPICLAEAGGEAVRPRAAGAVEALVDQLCVDIPAPQFDREADFLAELTGWERRPGSLPEFEVLVRPPEMPLQLLLQRIGEDAGPVRAHPDWACRDLHVERGRHLDAGAVVVRETVEWTTLRDPAGLEYCLTDSDPDTGK